MMKNGIHLLIMYTFSCILSRINKRIKKKLYGLSVDHALVSATGVWDISRKSLPSGAWFNIQTTKHFFFFFKALDDRRSP